MITYLRTDTEAEMTAALIGAGVLLDQDGEVTIRPGYAVSFVGTIYALTGETEVVQPLAEDDEPFEREVVAAIPGWHANVLGDLSDDVLAALPTIPEPKNPVVVFAGRSDA